MEDLLNRPALVLNKAWQPIDSVSVREAFCDVMSNRASFLDTESYTAHDIVSWMSQEIADGEPYIQAVRGQVKVPEIMLLTGYSKMPVRRVVFCRRNLWRRDRRHCQYCGKEPPPDEVSIDHVHPRSKGGLSTFENCVLACTPCNLKKGDRTLQQAGMKLKRTKRLSNGEWTEVFYSQPKRPMWNPLYALRRKTFPKSWGAFLKNFDEALYWEVELET